jgi:hypothetical protein
MNINSEIYISLGYNCSPRFYIKNIGLSNSNGYLTCPFDLCITNLESLYNCIETDFEFFFDDLKTIPGMNAEGDRINCGDGGMNITNKYHMIFNHEGSTHSHLFNNEGKNDDLFYIRNDFLEFKKRYLKRIQNFHLYIQNHDIIHFVYKSEIDDNNIDKLKNLLLKKYNNKIINIIQI